MKIRGAGTRATVAPMDHTPGQGRNVPTRLCPRPLVALALLVATALALALAACSGGGGGGDDTTASSFAPPTTVRDDPGNALTVGQALGVGPSEVHVRGFLVAEEGAPVRLCIGLDTPPQCIGPFLEVHGLDLTKVEGLESSPGGPGPPLRFTSKEVVLVGVPQSGVLTVSEQPG